MKVRLAQWARYLGPYLTNSLLFDSLDKAALLQREFLDQVVRIRNYLKFHDRGFEL